MDCGLRLPAGRQGMGIADCEFQLMDVEVKAFGQNVAGCV
jgi:hypothetical protein